MQLILNFFVILTYFLIICKLMNFQIKKKIKKSKKKYKK